MTNNTDRTGSAIAISMQASVELEGGRKVVFNLNYSQSFTGQVQGYLESLGDIRDLKRIALVGNGCAAVQCLAAVELCAGLPEVALHGFAKPGEQAAPVLGYLDVGDYRHNQVRPHRSELPAEDDTNGKFIVLDGGGRGLFPFQRAELAKVLGCNPDDIIVRDFNLGQVDWADPTKGVVEKLLGIGLSFKTMTSGKVLYLPAANGLVAAVAATTIYGLSEAWPTLVRLNSELREGDEKPQFHVVELLHPQELRQWGRALYARLEAAQQRTGRIANYLRNLAGPRIIPSGVIIPNLLCHLADEVEAGRKLPPPAEFSNATEDAYSSCAFLEIADHLRSAFGTCNSVPWEEPVLALVQLIVS